MVRKVSVALVTLLLVVLFSSHTQASIEDSTWTVDVSIKVKMSAKKVGSESFSDTFVDTFYFDASGGFYSDYLGLNGEWRQSKSGFTINLDPAELEIFFEDLLFYEYGTTADLEVTKTTFKGKENKNGTGFSGSGSATIQGIVYADCGDVPGKITMTLKFKGIRD